MTPDEARHLRHELRTPVNHLMGYSDLLLEEGEPSEALANALGAVKAAGATVLEAVARTLGDGGFIDPAGIAALEDSVRAAEAAVAELGGVASREQSPDVERMRTASARLRELAASLRTDGQIPAATVAEHPIARAGNAGTVLVVDDDAANREVLTRRLVRLGYAVREAGDGRAALEAMAGGGIDLVLLDIMMPVMDGHAVLAARQRDAGLLAIPVVVVSALDEQESIVRCIEAGADDYLSKPFDPVILKARVAACIEKKRLRDAERAWTADLERRVAEGVRQVEGLRNLERFLPAQLAQALAGGDAAVLKSHRSEVAVLFTDLRGFTPFAEVAEPEDVMAVLRELHEAIGPLVFAHGGTLAQFTGDGMMVVFNDPAPCDEPAWKAVQLAAAMRERSTALATGWAQRGHALDMGIGVAFGHATCGPIGFEGRFEYTAIGTVVNLASRLCAEAKGGEVLVSQRVIALIDGRAASEARGELTLKGLSQPIPVFALHGLRSQA